jgi:hypothetical protein
MNVEVPVIEGIHERGSTSDRGDNLQYKSSQSS